MVVVIIYVHTYSPVHLAVCPCLNRFTFIVLPYSITHKKNGFDFRVWVVRNYVDFRVWVVRNYVDFRVWVVRNYVDFVVKSL